MKLISLGETIWIIIFRIMFIRLLWMFWGEQVNSKIDSILGLLLVAITGLLLIFSLRELSKEIENYSNCLNSLIITLEKLTKCK